MIFLRDGETARQWQGEEPDARDVLTLNDAVVLATAYFLPLMSDCEAGGGGNHDQ